MRKNKSLLTIIMTGACLMGLSLTAWLKSPSEYSDAERRYLEKFPIFNIGSVVSGEYMKEFETATTDQFPFREMFRSLKSYFVYDVFKQSDNNDIYMAGDYVSKLEYPMNEKLLDNASNKFEYLYDTYLKDTNTNIYFSIVPDKNYFMAEENGYLSIDYSVLVEYMTSNTEYMQYIDIFEQLELTDYYLTDTHWKQECIIDVARFLGKEMGTFLNSTYEENVLKKENGEGTHLFEGVYVGQSASSLKLDEIHYLTNDVIDDCEVYSYSTGAKKEISMYEFSKAYGKDSYEMFLNGTEAIIEIVNPKAESEKELVLFRDSFGSSIAPLLVEGYSKITLIDIRYIDSKLVGNFVKFDDQDVLFLYSTILLNNSNAFR